MNVNGTLAPSPRLVTITKCPMMIDDMPGDKALASVRSELAATGYDLSGFVEGATGMAEYCLKHPRLAVAIVIVIGAILTAACGPDQSEPSLAPTPIVATAISPTATDTIADFVPVGFDPPTSVPVTLEAPSPQPEAIQHDKELDREPTLKDMLVLDEGGEIPAEVRKHNFLGAMEQEKTRIAKQIGVKIDDVKILYKWNGLDGDYYRELLCVRIEGEGGGIAWPVNIDTGLLAEFPAHFEIDDPLAEDWTVHVDQDYDWILLGGEEARLAFAGTKPVIADRPVKATVDGKERDVFSAYIRPGGKTVETAQDSKQWEAVVGAQPDIPTVVTEGSEAAEIGIPIGAELTARDGAWVYVIANPVGKEVVVGSFEGSEVEAIEAIRENYTLATSQKDAINHEFPKAFVERCGPGLEIANLNTPPFSEDAKPITKIITYTERSLVSHSRTLFMSKDNYDRVRARPESSPYRVRGYYSFRDGDSLYMGAVADWLDRSGRIKTLCMAYAPHRFGRVNMFMGVWPRGFFVKDTTDRTVRYPFIESLGEDKETNRLLQELIDTGEIPEGLQHRLLSGG